jgi:hypothetical protein
MNNEQPTLEAPEQPMLPGMEELAAENETLKAEIRMRTAVYDLETRLTQAGARSPGLLAERAKESYQFSDEGELTNAQAVVEHLKKTWPEQFAAPSIDATAGRIRRPTLTKEALARMTPAEVQSLDWNEVKATLSNG